MRKVTVSRMRERYAQTVFTFRITYVPVPSSSSSSSSVGLVANATDVLQPNRLIVLTLSPTRLFGRSHFRRQVPPLPQRRERS